MTDETPEWGALSAMINMSGFLGRCGHAGVAEACWQIGLREWKSTKFHAPDSPIEILFARAMLTVAWEAYEPPSWLKDPNVRDQLGDPTSFEVLELYYPSNPPIAFFNSEVVPDYLCLCQPKLANGGYADFAVWKGRPGAVEIGKGKCVWVECDGHDFHERTKEQAARDRARDRAIQATGDKILRFTGSEIHRDATACAREALSQLKGSG